MVPLEKIKMNRSLLLEEQITSVDKQNIKEAMSAVGVALSGSIIHKFC